MIVGRDTAGLSESEVARATVETVAESSADGIIAPLLYLAIGGAPLAMAYKAINTLDSMMGHRNDRYVEFGWASARLDDLANWIPARLAALLLIGGAGLVIRQLEPIRRGWRVFMRDGGKHPSPNSGRPEAAMAGLLGVRLGGTNFYDGVPQDRPLLGPDGREPESGDIPSAAMVMAIASVLGVFLAVGIRWLL
jgi:adenosylcobinamide-phosphate synthase